MAPSWSEVRAAPRPVYLAPPRLRWAWPTLIRRLAGSPALVRELRRAGFDARGVLRFLLWLDTAACFGVEAVEVSGVSPGRLDRHLPGTAPATEGRPGSVAVVVIAKDEEVALRGALASAEGFADELIVVVDSASRDGTADVAVEMGARVLRRALAGDFAAQRNAGIAAARTDWVVCIDADERLDPGLADMLRLAMAWPGADAVFVPILNLIDERGEDPVHWPDVQARVFRSHLRYAGPVHERVERWRHPLLTPVSGPFVRHRKSLLAQHRATLLYDGIDPTPYSREMIASVREEAKRLERSRQAANPDDRGDEPRSSSPRP